MASTMQSMNYILNIIGIIIFQKQTSIDAKKNESELETTGGKCIEKSKKKRKRKKPKNKKKDSQVLYTKHILWRTVL